MAVKVADTIESMNSSFPAMMGTSINVDINGVEESLQDAIDNGDITGSTIQADTLPIPTAENENFILQYTGSSGTYTNGFFYQCKVWGYLGWDCDGTILYTKDTETVVGKNVYIDSSGTMSLEGTITQVADDYSTLTYIDINEDTHECTRDSNEDMANQGYTWIEKEVSPSNVKVDNESIVQDSSTHKISVANTYETTKTCKDIDEWNALSPTEQAKYENVILEQDETTIPISIVDIVKNGDLHAVTSNAVYDHIKTVKDLIPSTATTENKLTVRNMTYVYENLFPQTSTTLDLDTLVNIGTYSYNDFHYVMNSPSEFSGVVTVYPVNESKTYLSQCAIDLQGHIFIRHREGQANNWSSWQKLATEKDTVRWIGKAEGLTLAQIYNTYSKQNTSMYKGFLDWNDSRCPIYGQGADTVEITCYDWNLTAKSIRGQNYYYDDTNNVWIKNTNISQGTLTFPAQTIQSGEYAEVTIPLSANEFYCGRLDFTNLPSVNLTISYNDFSGLLQDTKSTQNRSQDVLIVVGKATQLILHVYLTNYTGQPVTIGNVDVTYYLEHHVVKE